MIDMDLTGLPDATSADLDREAVRRWGLCEFVRLAWPLVEPIPLRESWYTEAICEHLQALQSRQITDLVINQPPSTGKSLFGAVFFPAWVWTLDASHGFICASYSDKLALRDARRARELVASEWYRDRWPEVELAYKGPGVAMSDYWTTAGGQRYSQPIGGQFTGQHGDTHVIDDPIDPAGAAIVSGAELDEVDRWDSETMPTRFKDLRRRGRVLTQQRLHERDLAAKWIREGATVLCLPMRGERAHPLRWIRDPRAEGESLDPERFPDEVIRPLEKILGPTQSAGQLQQRPSPAGGSVFRREWLQNYWTVLPPGGTWSQSWDLAFKARGDSSLVCGQVWYDLAANHYLVDQVLGHLGFNDTLEAIKDLTKRYPRAIRKRIEDKANGPAVMDALKSIVGGIEPIEPEGGKEARARAVEPLFAAGNVFFPHPDRAEYEDGRRGAPWVRGGVPIGPLEAAHGSLEYYFEKFPRADHDDPVDTATQHLVHTANSPYARLKAAMDKQFQGR